MVDEKWEEWEEHSVSEQIVLAKAGQTLGVFGLKYTLKKRILLHVSKSGNNMDCTRR